MKEYKTKAKDALLGFFRENKDKRLTANDAYNHMIEEGNIVNLATIYRNLDKMVETSQLLRTKNVSDGSCFYQYNEQKVHCEAHLHMQCKMCGKVLHMNDEFMCEFYKYVEKDKGFKLDCKESNLVGICKDCVKQA